MLGDWASLFLPTKLQEKRLIETLNKNLLTKQSKNNTGEAINKNSLIVIWNTWTRAQLKTIKNIYQKQMWFMSRNHVWDFSKTMPCMSVKLLQKMSLKNISILQTLQGLFLRVLQPFLCNKRWLSFMLTRELQTPACQTKRASKWRQSTINN